MILGYFIEFKAFCFRHRFFIMNSAIVELAKLAIFSINILYIITRNQISLRIAIYSILVQNIASLAVAMELLCWLLGRKT